ncbi:MAG: prepilin-type N-terminal cleavage/methylation domain-containing protein [Candidatus Eremiobacteraeota bacterium]|nr:prepilin-type N-terminal cleavage/methylation domain-containing protein [Candidatus Eremiobacteraeota bacterium]
MGLSSKTLRRGFTILEILTVIGISSLLLALLAQMFRVGLWESTRSSGRIELVRRGRQAIDNTQRYLASACQPGSRQNPDLQQAEAVFGPDALDDLNNPNPTSYVRFWSADDFLGNEPARGARELQNDPSFYAYDIGTIPGGDLGGQDLVLRRFEVPLEPLLPTAWDTAAQPRYLARGLGVSDGSGGAEDGFVVRHLRQGAVHVQVNLSSAFIDDDLQRNKIEDATPMRIKMSSIYQLPYYNIQ